MKHLTLMFLVALTVAACKKEAPPTTPEPPDNGGDTGNVGGDDTAQADPAACTTDDECVAVELECCDECNGGKAVAVNREHEAATVADSPRGRGECEQTMCTKMACAPWEVTCDGGTCALKRGTF